MIRNRNRSTVDWEAFILREIRQPMASRRSVAHTYGIMLRESGDTVDWDAIHAAIRARWGESAVSWIKNSAWYVDGEKS